MPRPCLACLHPERKAIDDALHAPRERRGDIWGYGLYGVTRAACGFRSE